MMIQTSIGYLMNHTSMVIVCDRETKFLLYKLNFSWIGDYLTFVIGFFAILVR